MKAKDQRIAIAEACGWAEWNVCSTFDRKTTIKLWTRGDLGRETRCELPDYLNDLNAMHEAEKTLTHTSALRYHNTLRDIVDETNKMALTLRESCLSAESFQWHATAAQRAEAFLKAIGKWKD